MATTHDPVLAQAIYDAFLKAAIAMGDDIKTMSWFGRNVKAAGKAVSKPAQLADACIA